MEPGLGGRCPNGVQHTGIKFPSYCGGGGGGGEHDSLNLSQVLSTCHLFCQMRFTLMKMADTRFRHRSVNSTLFIMKK